MNLHLNLLADSEIRSGSNISRKFIIGLIASAVPLVLLSIILFLVFAQRQAHQDLAAVQDEQRQLDPVYKTVLELKGQLAKSELMAEEIDGWRSSRINWYSVLTELQKLIPPNAQLTHLTINERIESEDGRPARKLLLIMKGKVAGRSAREDIQALDRRMKENKTFSALMSDVDVRLLGGSENAKEPDVCMFDATCVFKSRKIGERKPMRERNQ